MLVLALTSQPQPEFLRLEKWSELGLNVETWVKPTLFCLESESVQRLIGRISPSEIQPVRDTMRMLVDKSFQFEGT